MASNPFEVTPVNPLQALMLGQQSYEGARKRTAEQATQDALRAAAPDLAAGNFQAAIGKIGAGGGDQSVLFELAKLASTDAQRRQAQANADRSFKLQEQQFAEGKTPPGFTRSGGTLAPIPGGPADPNYLQTATEARTKPREFSVSDITKLEETGSKLADSTRYLTTFKPAYGGYQTSLGGSAATTVGRYLPKAIVGEDIAEGANWWADYQRSKNQIRNDLFGSALTATEKGEFEKADINPGMQPDQIQKNLDRQNTAVKNAAKKKANALILAGYDPAPIAAAYGLDLKELGVTAQPTRGRGVGTKGDRQPVAPLQNDRPEIADARMAIGRGAPRDKVEKRLREMGVPFKPGDLDLN